MAFSVPNAASDLEVTANLQSRMISCSMKVNAPGDRKRASSRVNWLVRQLRGVDGDDVIVRAVWIGRGGATQASLSEIKTDPACLDSSRTGAVPRGFEVIMNRELAGRFSGRRTFIEDLEDLIPEFYDRIGRKLRRWDPPPPPIDKRDPIDKTDIVEPDHDSDADGISQTEPDQPHNPKEACDAGSYSVD